MVKIDIVQFLKKWIPVLVLVFIVVVILAIIFHSSIQQIFSSIIVSVILIFSALLFRSVGRDRKNQDDNTDTTRANN